MQLPISILSIRVAAKIAKCNPLESPSLTQSIAGYLQHSETLPQQFASTQVI